MGRTWISFGRPAASLADQVAKLGPAHRRRWVGGAALADVWRGASPRSLGEDLERLPALVVDPFSS